MFQFYPKNNPNDYFNTSFLGSTVRCIYINRQLIFYPLIKWLTWCGISVFLISYFYNRDFRGSQEDTASTWKRSIYDASRFVKGFSYREFSVEQVFCLLYLF